MIVFLNKYKCWLNFKVTFGAFLKTPYTLVYEHFFTVNPGLQTFMVIAIMQLHDAQTFTTE